MPDMFVARTSASLCRRMQNDPAHSTSPGTWPAGKRSSASQDAWSSAVGFSWIRAHAYSLDVDRSARMLLYGLDVSDVYVQQPALRTTRLRIQNGRGFSSLSNSRKAFAGQSSRRETPSTPSTILSMPFLLARQ
jgi:hypothetical protein